MNTRAYRMPRAGGLGRSGLRAPINDQDSGVDARRGVEGPAGDTWSEVDIEDSSPVRSRRSRRAHPPSCCLLLKHEPRRQQPTPGLKDSAEKRIRDGERGIRHDVVWPLGQPQVGCVGLHDDDLVSEAGPQIVGALRVRLDSDHSCTCGHERAVIAPAPAPMSITSERGSIGAERTSCSAQRASSWCHPHRRELATATDRHDARHRVIQLEAHCRRQTSFLPPGRLPCTGQLALDSAAR